MDRKNNKLQIVNIPIKKLKPALYNPRKISDKDFEQLVESVRQYSMVEPLVVNSNPERHNTVSSNIRKEVAKYIKERMNH
jgi:ParB-like chromosome segregation protein Spo0J